MPIPGGTSNIGPLIGGSLASSTASQEGSGIPGNYVEPRIFCPIRVYNPLLAGNFPGFKGTRGIKTVTLLGPEGNSGGRGTPLGVFPGAEKGGIPFNPPFFVASGLNFPIGPFGSWPSNLFFKTRGFPKL